MLTVILFRLPMLLQPGGEFEEGAEQGGTIIVDQLDQTRLLHQAAEFDQMAGSGTSILHPLARVVAGAVTIEAIAQHHQPLPLRF